EMLTATASSAQRASQQGQPGGERIALRLLNVRQHLLDTTEAGQQLKAQEAAVTEAMQELQALGEQPTREGFVDLLARNADNPMKVEALAMLGRNFLDYTTFQLVTQRIEKEKNAE